MKIFDIIFFTVIAAVDTILMLSCIPAFAKAIRLGILSVKPARGAVWTAGMIACIAVMAWCGAENFSLYREYKDRIADYETRGAAVYTEAHPSVNIVFNDEEAFVRQEIDEYKEKAERSIHRIISNICLSVTWLDVIIMNLFFVTKEGIIRLGGKKGEKFIVLPENGLLCAYLDSPKGRSRPFYKFKDTTKNRAHLAPLMKSENYNDCLL